jgi:prolipoprotein diacylglyceryltransferase
LSAFTEGIALALLAGGGLCLWRARAGMRGALATLLIAALAAGMAGARLEHVLLHWGYFSANIAEALDPRRGGLGWHGAVLGALLALATGWRLLPAARRPFATWNALLASLAPTLPLLMLAAWAGCGAAGCGYGAEVLTLADYPPLLVAELRDVYGIIAPRFNTSLLGGACAILIAALLMARRRGSFWLTLLLASAGMFVIGYVRADTVPALGSLRADQLLDVLFVAGSAGLWWVTRRAQAR